jgi:hypothetical protein
MNDVVPRFEFRTFAPCLGMVDQRLRAMAGCPEISESREIYLLGRDGVRDTNIKLRRGRLELKRMIERRHDLERWRPAGQWAFPVARDTIRVALRPGATREQLTDLPARVSSRDLLHWVARPGIPLYRANVWKRRFRFALQGCRAELDQLLVNGAAVESVAVESEDAQAVLELCAALRLEDCENQSYPLLLSRILALTPLPHEEDYG